MINAGVAVDEKQQSGETPLYLAAKKGHVEIVKYLLKAGANPVRALRGSKRSLGTPLHAAVMGGDIEIVRLLLAADVNPNLDDKDLGPPLHVAISWDEIEIAKMLRQKGAKPIAANSVSPMIKSANLGYGKSCPSHAPVATFLSRNPIKRLRTVGHLH